MIQHAAQAHELLSFDGLLFSVLHCQGISVGLGQLHRVFAENSSEDVQQGDLDEEDEEEEQHGVYCPRVIEHGRVGGVVEVDLPIGPARNGLVERQHCLGHRAERLHHPLSYIGRHLVFLLDQVCRQTLDEDESEDVEDKAQQCERPEERDNRAEDRVQHQTQLREEAHHPHDAEDLGHLHDPQGAHESQVHATRVLQCRRESPIVECEQNQYQIENVPSHVLVAKEVKAMHYQFQQQLNRIEGQEERLHHCDEPGCRVRAQHPDLVVSSIHSEDRVHDDDDGASDLEELTFDELVKFSGAARFPQFLPVAHGLHDAIEALPLPGTSLEEI
mmetsp:Transcript_134758/g.300337  ORF Transcript_134758/g.300337 Transcript_134758/m.300337 type:complete len:331 (-) Transcript_134758:407-1399(-)